MKRYFVTFRSVTYAQRGESVLRSAGIRCSLQRTPRWMEEHGCGYGVELQPRDVARGVDLLRQQQVVFRKVYGQSATGEMQEVAL